MGNDQAKGLRIQVLIYQLKQVRADADPRLGDRLLEDLSLDELECLAAKYQIEYMVS